MIVQRYNAFTEPSGCHAFAEFNGSRYFLGSAIRYYEVLRIIKMTKPLCPHAFFFGSEGSWVYNGTADELSMDNARSGNQ